MMRHYGALHYLQNTEPRSWHDPCIDIRNKRGRPEEPDVNNTAVGV
jgi:hypothetical protein